MPNDQPPSAHVTNAVEGPGASKGSRRVALVVVLGVVGLLGAGIGLRMKEAKVNKAQLEEKQAATPRASLDAPPPETMHAKAERWVPAVPLTGSLVPAQEADLAFKGGGRLATIAVQVGDTVKKGQRLATVDADEVNSQSAAAVAGVRVAEVNLQMAVDAEKRAKSLFSTGSIPEVEMTTAEQRAAAARAQVEQARAQARLAATGVSNAVLVAPFDGVITRVPSGPGKIVAPGEVLFHLEDLSILKLNGTLSEGEAKLVAVGATVELGGATGSVVAVLASLDAQTRRVPVIAEIKNPGTLLARSFVRATIKSKSEIDVLRLPLSALVPGTQDQVAVVEQGKIRTRSVAFVGTPTSLLVQQGLAATDVVLAAPGADVKDGAILPTK